MMKANLPNPGCFPARRPEGQPQPCRCQAAKGTARDNSIKGISRGLKLRRFAGVLAVAGLAARGLVAAEAGGGAETFKLREVSVFDQGDDSFLRGQAGGCGNQPFAEVKTYPVFKSEKPLYGSVRFFQDYRDEKTALVYYFALDESQGTGKGYDRFYFEANRDLDLRNDMIVKPQTRPPEGARSRYSDIKQQVIFDFLALPFDCGPEGTRWVQLLPRFTIAVYGKEEYPQMSFVRTRLYAGDIKIGGQEFAVRLGNDYSICGRLDSPGTVLRLSPKAKPDGRSYWWGGDRLMAAHKIRDRFYTFSANSTGDRLTVHPYSGGLGTFEIGPGGRALDSLSVSGSLEARDLAVPVGGEVVDGSPKEARRCQIPVGDYRPNYITVGFGRLRISLSHNYHSEGKPRDRGERPPVYGMTVRQDQPFVLDFSNPPEVMFASPAKAQRVKPGEELQVKAVLVDPKLDFMIRGLEDTSRKQTQTPDGKPLGYGRNLSLDPKVIITRANGDKVAEGVMPFG